MQNTGRNKRGQLVFFDLLPLELTPLPLELALAPWLMLLAPELKALPPKLETGAMAKGVSSGVSPCVVQLLSLPPSPDPHGLCPGVGHNLSLASL